MNTKTWTIWVGGGEINDYPVTLERAQQIAEYWLSQGYDDTQISNIEKGNKC
jgi:hypothetical protein